MSEPEFAKIYPVNPLIGVIGVLTFFLASCVSIERNNPDDPGSENYVAQNPNYTSSPSSKPSSSSVQTGVIEGTPVEYGGEIYKTVVIGTQTWFKRNLNYDVDGSRCYNGQDSYCATYGRLYDWNAAMNACPEGWHLPSSADWNILMKFLNPNCSDNSHCAKAGTKLKAISGWNVVGGVPQGTDDYGFTALPGAAVYLSGHVDEIGGIGIWWSSTEYTTETAWCRLMDSDVEYVTLNYFDKSFDFFSVRCIKD